MGGSWEWNGGKLGKNPAADAVRLASILNGLWKAGEGGVCFGFRKTPENTMFREIGGVFSGQDT